ncbi:polysaccharide deacetylase family protein [Candidatus Bodocaedibacter vickermanii]|uniref:Chitooligosaccharide deacetylase n=1 Tax=Candidatus Bodocaedibacter vickermanii TaxID=2741701 RepID=A0A7L9RRN6_9PROT|nr:Bifunctional xylanase/deacetylase [Candidatus Paracaedibacteraceae bacterium 'Lake Konstanz']
MFKTCASVCLFLIGSIETVGATPSSGSDRLLKRLWPGDKLTSSYGGVLNPQKAAVDESMPDYSIVPELPSLSDRWRGTIRSVHSKSAAKYVAITLDYCELCTNVNGYQSQVIKYLRDQNVPATLFISGKWMRSHPDIAQQLIVDPLFEIGNHAWSHANFGIAPVDLIEQQVLATQAQYILLRDQIAQTALSIGMGDEMSLIPPQPVLFRLPYGRCNDVSLQRLQHFGLKVIQWNHVGLEGYPATQSACEAFVDKLHSGSIVLLHGNHVPKHTLSFLQKVIPLLRQKGFTCVTVSTLLETGTAVVIQDGYFVKPADNLSLDTQFGFMGTGVRK